jgi:ABC-type lipoprotein release transport system permease subunit
MRPILNIAMRIISTLLGLLMLAMGSVWMMQGLGIGPDAIMQGFMVGDLHWTLYGALLALVGIAQVVWSNARR